MKLNPKTPPDPTQLDEAIEQFQVASLLYQDEGRVDSVAKMYRRIGQLQGRAHRGGAAMQTFEQAAQLSV